MPKSKDPNVIVDDLTLEDFAKIVTGAAELGRQAGENLTSDMVARYVNGCLEGMGVDLNQ